MGRLRTVFDNVSRRTIITKKKMFPRGVDRSRSVKKTVFQQQNNIKKKWLKRVNFLELQRNIVEKSYTADIPNIFGRGKKSKHFYQLKKLSTEETPQSELCSTILCQKNKNNTRAIVTLDSATYQNRALRQNSIRPIGRDDFYDNLTGDRVNVFWQTSFVRFFTDKKYLYSKTFLQRDRLGSTHFFRQRVDEKNNKIKIPKTI